MLKKKGLYSNIVALAREDAREYRIVNGKNSDVLSQRWYYRLCWWAKLAGFAVFAVMSLLFIGGAATELAGSHSYTGDAGEIAQAIAELKNAILVVSVALGVCALGFGLTFIKNKENPSPVINIIGAVIVAALCIVVCVFLFFAAKSSVNYFDGGKERYIWCFAVPGAVLVVSTLCQAILGALETGADKARYNAVLEEVYDKFMEKKENGIYTEEEWGEFVASYKRKPNANPVKRKRKK